MATKRNPGISDKVQEIKRMQKNWMNQRASVNSEQTSSIGTQANKGSRSKTTCKETAKKPDTVSWVVGSGTKKKPTSVRARSASPARPSNRSASGTSNPRSSSAKDAAVSKVSSGRPPSSGRPTSSNRPPSSRSDSGSAKKPKSPGEVVSKERMFHAGSEPNLYHRVESNPSTTSTEPGFRTDPSNASKQHTDQWNFTGERTSSQSERPTKVAVQSESVQSVDSQSDPTRPIANQSHDRLAEDASQLGPRTRDLMGPDTFDKLADQIASRVRADLKQERSQMMQSMGFTGKSVLEDDNDDESGSMSSHKCSKCKQLMVAPDHTPYVLIPCGHTLCEACSEDRIKCPTCRARVSSIAVNTTLQQIITTSTGNNHHTTVPPAQFSTNHESAPSSHQHYNPSEYSSHPVNNRKPSASGPYHSDNRDNHGDGRSVHPAYNQSSDRYNANPPSNIIGYGEQKGAESGRRKITPEEQAEKYFNEYQNLLIRCEAMEGEEEEILAAVERKNRNIAKQKKQITNITSEQDRLRGEVQKIEERIAALDGHRREYEQQCHELEEDKREQSDRLTMVRDMLRGLERAKEKIKLLARKYNMSLD